jgi:hypothetical protein
MRAAREIGIVRVVDGIGAVGDLAPDDLAMVGRDFADHVLAEKHVEALYTDPRFVHVQHVTLRRFDAMAIGRIALSAPEVDPLLVLRPGAGGLEFRDRRVYSFAPIGPRVREPFGVFIQALHKFNLCWTINERQHGRSHPPPTYSFA